ncbi:MAG: hypothetical protein R3A10_11805 [Caldilineaceae bacterium]
MPGHPVLPAARRGTRCWPCTSISCYYHRPGCGRGDFAVPVRFFGRLRTWPTRPA